MDKQNHPSESHPPVNSFTYQKEINNHTKIQESFRQNFSFAEKILDFQGIFPTLSDDHDIRKVTRKKVEIMLYAQHLKAENQGYKEVVRRGPYGVNQWIWENKVQQEIPEGFLREFLVRSMNNVPWQFFNKYEHVRKLLVFIANLHGITSAQVQNGHLIDPDTLQQASKHLIKDRLTPLYRFLMRKSIQFDKLKNKFPLTKNLIEQPLLHPRILSFKMNLEEKGYSRKHIRNTVTHVQQLLAWLSANVQVFGKTSPNEISVFQIQYEHLLMYRTYKLKMVKEGLCSVITFTHIIYAVRSFFRFLKDRYGYDVPLQRFRSIKAPRYHSREIPTNDQIEAFFHVVDHYAENPLLEQLAYRFMLHLGLRLNEVATIKWRDINLETRTIVIHSKGKKSHVLPLAGRIHSLLKELQQQPVTTYLMGEKTSTIRFKLYEDFKLYAMIADWRFSGGVHLFRHTFITNLAHKGILPQAIKELARVTMLDTVGLYLHMAYKDEYMNSQINLLKYE